VGLALQRPGATRRASGLGRRLLAVDIVSLLVGWWVGAAVSGAGPPPASRGMGIGAVAVGVVATVVCFAVAGLYRPPVNGVRSGTLGSLVQCFGLAAVAVIVYQGLAGDAHPRSALTAVAAALVATVLARCGFDTWLVGRREDGDFRTPVVVAGAAAETAALVDFLRLNPEAGFHPVAVAGVLERTCETVRRTGASDVLVAAAGLPSQTVNRLVERLTSAGIPVHVSTGLTGVSRARMRTFALAHQPIVHVDPPRHSIVQRAAKRTLDVAVASALLVAAAPVIAVAAALIKAHDRGPVLFRQVRIGRYGRPFTVLKLRTMTVDAEARVAELRHRNERRGPLFKVARDPRVTPIGGLLRSTAVDELPQLVNVLTGRMSIVGPRPALPAEAAEFDDELQRRHLVRPGVTGLWQVEANHKASFGEYRRLDLFYVENWSLGGDLAVVVDTIQAVSRRVLRALRRPAPKAPPAQAPAGPPPPLPDLPDALEAAP
jgi:exopolysaccharide biosynthesis polyprenyl glycosylphosphotransferase